MVCFPPLQEIDELLGQNLTEEDEEAIAAELDSILIVSNASIVEPLNKGLIGRSHIFSSAYSMYREVVFCQCYRKFYIEDPFSEGPLSEVALQGTSEKDPLKRGHDKDVCFDVHSPIAF